ncbi:hypothetical protein N7534_010972 [Penicillium rubens]|nr:hypothetical protein N7534_010972 [Penicillium rubens]
MSTGLSNPKVVRDFGCQVAKSPTTLDGFPDSPERPSTAPAIPEHTTTAPETEDKRQYKDYKGGPETGRLKTLSTMT